METRPQPLFPLEWKKQSGRASLKKATSSPWSPSAQVLPGAQLSCAGKIFRVLIPLRSEFWCEASRASGFTSPSTGFKERHIFNCRKGFKMWHLFFLGNSICKIFHSLSIKTFGDKRYFFIGFNDECRWNK